MPDALRHLEVLFEFFEKNRIVNLSCSYENDVVIPAAMIKNETREQLW